MLTSKDIENLSKREGVRPVAVRNFLGSLEGLTYQEAVGNVEMDARSYRWSLETVAAIREGLLKHFF